MDMAWWSFRETKRTTFIERCRQLGVAFVALVHHWGESCVVLDEQGELVRWPVIMM